MVPFTKSLNTKLLVLIAFIVTLAGALTAVFLAKYERHRLEQRLGNTLIAEAEQFTSALSEEFAAHKQLMAAAARRFEQDLEDLSGEVVPQSDYEGYEVSKIFRRYDQHSSIILPQQFKLTDSAKREIDLSGQIWGSLAPLMNNRFNPLFFISRHGYARVTPAYRVAALPADFQPLEVSIYQMAVTSIGKADDVLQGTVNFDQISNAYSVALAQPISLNNDFAGVLGGSINISQWAKLLMGLDIEGLVNSVMIFDGQGEMVLTSAEFLSHRENLLAGSESSAVSKAQVNKGGDLITNYTVGDDSKALISQLIEGYIKPMTINRASIDGQNSYYTYSKFPGLNWYLLMSYDQGLMDVQAREVRTRILICFIALVVVLCIVLVVAVKVSFSNRVLELSKATERLRKRQWQYRVPERGKDEISFLGGQINLLADKLSETFSDLSDSITQLKQANLQASKFISAIEHSSAIVIIFNAKWQVEYTNACFKATSGIDSTDIHFRDALLIRDDDKQTEDEIRACIEAGQDWHGEYAAVDSSGESMWLQQLVYPVRNDAGEVVNYVATGRNITEIKEGQIKMERLAFYDALTGLQNRSLFRDQIERELIVCQREKAQLALMYLDLDHFKRINDTMGHDAGDELLVTVSNRLRNCLRQEDAVARFGGDEFGIMLSRIGSPHYASIVANKIISELNKPIYLQTQEVMVGVSIGITLAPHDGSSLSTLLKNADLAMYQAKDKGRNSFQFFTQDMNHEISDRLELERDIKKALKNHEFLLYFQPQIDLSNGRIVGAEALVRWFHPEQGLRSPLDFIPMAEETGLIVPLGKWILRAACQQAKSIHKGLSLRVPISVNLSARQLADKSFVDSLSVVLQETRLDPTLLELEVTESLLMDNIDEVSLILDRVRALGVRIAIDDFGTGYSSLSYIKRLPINRLKIDRSFIKDLPDNQEDREITSLIVAMAKNLKLEVLAEGAETKAQVDLLQELECGLSQGFYHSKPITADKLMIMLFEQGVVQGLRKVG